MSRFAFGRRGLLGATLAAAAGAGQAQAPLRITDLLGRTVSLPGPARRLVLAQGRHVLALALLHDDPVSLVAGWAGDLRQMNPPDYAAVRARFPAADAIPLIGRNTLDTLSVEAIVAARPDAVVLSRGGSVGGHAEALAARLNGFGLPTLVVDFYADPLRDTPRSIAILGALIGAEDRAAAFTRFYNDRLEAIAARLAGVAARPSVFIHAHAGGTPCCGSPGRGVFDSFVRHAGGRNIGAEILPGVTGTVALEQVLTHSPDVYVATAGPFAGRGGIPIGRGVEPEAVRREMCVVLRRERLSGLTVLETLVGALRAVPTPLAGNARAAAQQGLRMLARLEIEELAPLGLDRLSGGQRQLVGLAQALVRQPAVLLLDEPTSALDLRHQVSVLALVQRMVREGGLIGVVVLHDLGLAARFGDRVVALQGGAVWADGTAEATLTPALLASVYGVEGRVERCSRGTLVVLADAPLRGCAAGAASGFQR